MPTLFPTSQIGKYLYRDNPHGTGHQVLEHLGKDENGTDCYQVIAIALDEQIALRLIHALARELA